MIISVILVSEMSLIKMMFLRDQANDYHLIESIIWIKTKESQMTIVNNASEMG